MPDTTVTAQPEAVVDELELDDDVVLDDDLLVEDVSIDGMCGVY